MTFLVCGSLAYDTIMTFDGHFSGVILPDQLHKLNAAFLVPVMRREFGGCAGNIAYNLKLLGGDPLIMATVGQDGEAYQQRLRDLDIRTEGIKTIDEEFTAQAFITTDCRNNQLTAFHPGAMMHSHMNRVANAGPVELAIVAPDGREGMLQHAADCAELNIPFIFDPGQGLPMFSGEELLNTIDLASYVTLNDYEAALMVERTGQSLSQLATHCEALIVTHGETGSQIFTGGREVSIPSVTPSKVVDPTGCGDAYRAGLLFGLSRGMDWQTTGHLAALMGTIKIECQGGQNHLPPQHLIEERFKDAFGYHLRLN